MSDPVRPGEPGERPTPRSFWFGLVPGLALMAWGVRLYLDATPDLARRIDLAGWLVGLDLAHDLVLAPLILGLGALVTRVTPSRLRAPVQAALIATGTVLAVGLLPLLGSAEKTGNPTIQPVDYAPSIAVVVVAIWLSAGIVAVVRRPR